MVEGERACVWPTGMDGRTAPGRLSVAAALALPPAPSAPRAESEKGAEAVPIPARSTDRRL